MAPIILNIVIHETKLQKMLAFDTKVISYLMMFKTKTRDKYFSMQLESRKGLHFAFFFR